MIGEPINYKVYGVICITDCPHKMKHGVGCEIIKVATEQCIQCEYYEDEDINQMIIYCKKHIRRKNKYV